MSDDTSSNAWMRKCTTPDRSASFTISGQCVNTSTMLKISNAGMKRDSVRTVSNSHRGASTRRSSHAGMPSSSSGATTMVKQQVLHHVDAEVVALGDVVHRVVGRHPHREHARATST